MVPSTNPLQHHLSQPYHPGRLERPDAAARAVNPACGDELELTLRLENGLVVEARFLATGCAAALAAGSALSRLIEGCRVDRIETEITPEAVETALGGLPRTRQHAAALAVQVAHLAADSARRPKAEK